MRRTHVEAYQVQVWLRHNGPGERWTFHLVELGPNDLWPPNSRSSGSVSSPAAPSHQLVLEDLDDRQNSQHCDRSVKELQFDGTYSVNTSSIYAVVIGDHWIIVDLLMVPRSASSNPNSWYLLPSTAPTFPWLNYPVVDIAHAVLLCRFNDPHSPSHFTTYERHSEKNFVLDSAQHRIYLVTHCVEKKHGMAAVKAALEHGGTETCGDVGRKATISDGTE